MTAEAVVLATGASYRRIGIAALEELVGAGVFYGASGTPRPGSWTGEHVVRRRRRATPPGRR